MIQCLLSSQFKRILDYSNATTIWKQLSPSSRWEAHVVADLIRSLPTNPILLDLSCGTQPYRSATMGLKYFSCDFGKFAETPLEKSTIILGELYHLSDFSFYCDTMLTSIAYNSFDAIHCTRVLEHLPYPERALEKLHRILKPNGRACITTPGICTKQQVPYFFFGGFSSFYFTNTLTDIGCSQFIINEHGTYIDFLIQESLCICAYRPIYLLPLLITLPILLASRTSRWSRKLATMTIATIATKQCPRMR